MSKWRARYVDPPTGEGSKHLAIERPTPREMHTALKEICGDIIFILDDDEYRSFGQDAVVIARICGIRQRHYAVSFPSEKVIEYRDLVVAEGYNVAIAGEM